MAILHMAEAEMHSTEPPIAVGPVMSKGSVHTIAHTYVLELAHTEAYTLSL